MTNFTKENFDISGDFLHYYTEEHGRRFVARFKYGKNFTNWINFMIKNFTVEEYFSLLENSAPLKVMETKGYVLPHVKRILKRKGYPQTLEGLDAMLTDNRVAMDKAKI